MENCTKQTKCNCAEHRKPQLEDKKRWQSDAGYDMLIMLGGQNGGSFLTKEMTLDFSVTALKSQGSSLFCFDI